MLTFALMRYDNVKQGPFGMEIVEEGYFSADTIFTSEEEHFRFAFGITAFDGGKEEEEDAALYGRMVAKAVTWGLTEVDEGFQEKDLAISPCTAEQLGLEAGKEENSLFYPTLAGSSKSLSKYQKRLFCIDEPLELSGDSSAETGRTVKLGFEKAEACAPDEDTDCKTEAEITQWL